MATEIEELTRLLPFFVTQVLYWYTYLPASQPCFSALFYKCLPIVSLIYYVGFGPQSTKSRSVTRNILLGLVFGLGGDAALVYDSFFVPGMISFGIGHVFYIKAFEPKHGLSLKAAAALALIYLAFLWIIFPKLDDPDLMVGVPIYGILLLTMVLYAFSSATSCLKWITAISAALFAISDFIIVVNMKITPVENSQFWIMVTYYLAQFGITMTAFETFLKG